MILIIVLLALAIVFILALVAGNDKMKEDEATRKLDYERKKRLREQQRAQYEKDLSNQLSTYGEADNRIYLKGNFEEDDINKEFVVWGEKKILFIKGQPYAFSDILGYTIDDNQITRHGKVEYTSNTKTNTGSTIGRAVVGGVVAGGVGAVIGGATASKETKTISRQGDDKIIHDYTININTTSLKSPIIKVQTGASTDKTNQIIGILNIVLEQNK